MVRLTEVAEWVLAETVKVGGFGEDQAFRLRSAQQPYTLDVDAAREGDRVIRRDGQPILIVAPEADQVLRHTIIDVEQVDTKPKLVVRHLLP